MTASGQDDFDNNLVAAGAVLALLATSSSRSLESLEQIFDNEGDATNQIVCG